MRNFQEEEAKSGVEILTILHFSLISLVIIHLLYFIYILIKQNCSKNTLAQPEKPNNLRKINDQCSICLENILNEVQLLCSHSYCAKCIIDYSKTRYNFSDVQCPICRTDSRLMFALFERNEITKEDYDQILNYNHEVTSHYPSSFCFCLDMWRLCQIYLRAVANFQDSRFRRHRKVIIVGLMCLFILILYPILSSVSNMLEIFEDVFVYLFLIFACAEHFYTRFRTQTNVEFERIHSEGQQSIDNIQVDVDVNLPQGQNNQPRDNAQENNQNNSNQQNPIEV